MIVYVPNPIQDTTTVQCLVGDPKDFERLEDQESGSFSNFRSLNEIKEFLIHYNEENLHIANEESGNVYNSAKLAEIVEAIQKTRNPALFTMLTRQYQLRESVLNFLKEEMENEV